MKRIKTSYPGVYYRTGKRVGGTGTEKIFYVVFKRNGKVIEAKAGRQYRDSMTAAKASHKRAAYIDGDALTPAEQRAEDKKRKIADQSRWTMDRLWKEYLQCNPNLKGLITDLNRYELHLKKRFGDKEPVEILSLDIERMKRELRKKHSEGTINNVLELFRRVSNFGKKNRLCKGVDFEITLKKLNNLKTECLNPEQMTALLTAMDESSNIQVATLMKLALVTGMRRSALFRLQWSDIDYQMGFITLRESKSGIDRKIPLNKSAKDILMHHIRTPSKFVFPGRKGNQRKCCKRAVAQIRDAAGLPKDFRPLHGLRHTYASLLASSGQVDPLALQDLMTHESPAMLRRYAHLQDARLHQAAGVMDDILNGAGKKTDQKVIKIK